MMTSVLPHDESLFFHMMTSVLPHDEGLFFHMMTSVLPHDESVCHTILPYDDVSLATR